MSFINSDLIFSKKCLTAVGVAAGCFCLGIRTFVVQNLQNDLHQLKSNCHFRISDCDKASRKRKYSSASAGFPLINIFFKLYKLKIAKTRHKSVSLTRWFVKIHQDIFKCTLVFKEGFS